MKILLIIMLASLAFSAETIPGKYTTTCFVYDNAISYAVKPSPSKIRSYLGCSEFTETGRGADNCKECKSGKWKCQGYVIAYCGPDKEEEAKKKEEARKKAEAAAKKKAALEKERLEEERREFEREQEAKKEAKRKEYERREAEKKEAERKLLEEEIRESKLEKERLEKEKREAAALEKEAKKADEEYDRLMAKDKQDNAQRVTTAQNKLRDVELKNAVQRKQKAQKRRDARLAQLKRDRQNRARQEAQRQRERQARVEQEAQRERERLASEEREAQRRRAGSKNVFVDSSTGLMWQDDRAAKTTYINWSDAKRYCQNLSLAGRSDWYLPDKNQLEGLYEKKSRLKNVTSNYYWSSSVYVSGKERAWGVYFGNGYTYNPSKTYELYVRCVRGRQ